MMRYPAKSIFAIVGNGCVSRKDSPFFGGLYSPVVSYCLPSWPVNLIPGVIMLLVSLLIPASRSCRVNVMPKNPQRAESNHTSFCHCQLLALWSATQFALRSTKPLGRLTRRTIPNARGKLSLTTASRSYLVHAKVPHHWILHKARPERALLNFSL